MVSFLQQEWRAYKSRSQAEKNYTRFGANHYHLADGFSEICHEEGRNRREKTPETGLLCTRIAVRISYSTGWMRPR
jgi:hypothetical protein